MGIASNKLKFHGKKKIIGFGQKYNTKTELRVLSTPGKVSTPELYH